VIRGKTVPQSYQWSCLNHLQVGRYAEYFVKMQFVLLGFDVYSAEVDDRGIDFVLRRESRDYWDVQVKAIRKTGYVFMTKDKFRIRANLLLALALFEDGREPDLFLIPASRSQTPDGVFVDRDFPGRKSPPEYGINLSRKGIKALEPFRFDAAVESIFKTSPLTNEITR
jgi:hypothetical protein